MNNNEQNKKRKTTGILLSILAIISLVLITAGVTYAFFSYAKEGLTENVLTTGTITFYYDETYGTGTGVSIENALPMTDAAGKALSETTETFDFKVVSTVSGNTKIPYEITVRKDDKSTIEDSDVKIYLENKNSKEGTNYTLSESTVKTYDQLKQTKVKIPESITSEKTIWWGEVPANSTEYEAQFTLRMWIKGEEGENASADYSPYEFVKIEHDTEENALDAEALITEGDMITSTAYYKLEDEDRETYGRIAAVDQANKKVFTVGQKKALEESGEWSNKISGFTVDQSEDNSQGVQYYRLNDRTFKVNVNVYSGSATVVTAPQA